MASPSCWPSPSWPLPSLFITYLARGVPLSQNGFGFLIIYRVCMPHIIHRFSPPGHPHCLAIILVTQTNVEMMMAFGSIFVVFYEGVFPCQKSVSTTLSFVLSITRIFGGLPCVAPPHLTVPLASLAFFTHWGLRCAVI